MYFCKEFSINKTDLVILFFKEMPKSGWTFSLTNQDHDKKEKEYKNPQVPKKLCWFLSLASSKYCGWRVQSLDNKLCLH